MKITTQLKNNCKVIAEIKTETHHYVAAESFSPHEFVTWAIDEDGNAYWGHYMGQSKANALADLAERASLVAADTSIPSRNHDDNVPAMLKRQAD